MIPNWTPRDALVDLLMRHLYVWAPGEAEARRVIEIMADEMLQTIAEAGYRFATAAPDEPDARAAADRAGARTR